MWSRQQLHEHLASELGAAAGASAAAHVEAQMLHIVGATMRAVHDAFDP